MNQDDTFKHRIADYLTASGFPIRAQDVLQTRLIRQKRHQFHDLTGILVGKI